MGLDAGRGTNIIRSRASAGSIGGGTLTTGGRAGSLLECSDQRRAIRSPQVASNVSVVSSTLGLLKEGRSGTKLRSAASGSDTCLVLGGEVPEGLPEDLDARLDEGQGVALGRGDVGVDVGLVLGEEGVEVGLVDPGGTLD